MNSNDLRTRRYLAAYLPHWSTDLLKKRRPSLKGGAPLVLYEQAQNALRLYAVDEAAATLGLHPGQPLADARAMRPGLMAIEAKPAAEAAAFETLAIALLRYSPLVSLQG